MLRVLRDPRARRIYLVTKIVVVAVVGAGTIPLAMFIGPRAWYGFAVFAVVMVVLTVAVLAMTRAAGAADQVADEDEDEDSISDDEYDHSETHPELEVAYDHASTDPDLPLELPVEDSIDLHPFPPAHIPAVVSDYLEAAHAVGFREVRLIHGRGIGVQRERVRSILSRHPLVLELHDAPPARGGWGATVAYLRDEEIE